MINGSCSICGGLVETPDVWFGMIPPIPTCRSCGAYKAYPVIQMTPVKSHRHVSDFLKEKVLPLTTVNPELNNTKRFEEDVND